MSFRTRLEVVVLRVALLGLRFPYRSALELLGLAVLVRAAWTLSEGAGLAAAGVALVLAANFAFRRRE